MTFTAEEKYIEAMREVKMRKSVYARTGMNPTEAKFKIEIMQEITDHFALMPPLIEMPGRRFGRLVVIRRSDNNTTADKPMWLCACDCGRETHISGECLRAKKQKSCGCLRRETANRIGKEHSTTHGHSKIGNGNGSPEYLSWCSMIQRCTNPQATGYDRYGGAGIEICDRWRNSFANFLADMGLRPKGRSLDRVDPFGNYELSNCRWATIKEQRGNRHKSAEKLAERKRLL